MLLRWLLMILAVAGLCACAKPPQQKLDASRFLLARARAVQAPEFAPTEYQIGQITLQQAESLIAKGHYDEAEASLDSALQHTRRAIALTEDTKRKAEEEARKAALDAQKQKDQAPSVQISPKPAPAVSKPAPKPKPAKQPEPPPPTTYEVGEGETLWTISGQPTVYGDSLLWPLLYQANRDQIKDPRQIYPGQTLNIRRDLTPEEMEEARQKARESDIFPIPKP